MPNFYAHLKLCETVAERVSPELREILLRDADAYLCGGLGPDPLYFYRGVGMGRIRRAGLSIHHGSGAAAMEPFREPVKEKRPFAAAFAAGYLIHYLLDVRCHPFVKKIAAEGKYTHFALEGEYDRYLLRRDGLDYPAALPKKAFPAEFYALAAEMAEPVTPEIYKKALGDFRWVSLKIGAWTGTPVRSLVNAVSRIPPARPLRGMIPGKAPDPKLPRYLLTLDRLLHSAADTAAAELEGFFRAVREDAPLSRRLGRDFSGKETEDGLH